MIPHGNAQFSPAGTMTTLSSPPSRPFTSSLGEALSTSVPEPPELLVGRHSEDQNNSQRDRIWNNQNGSSANANINQGLSPLSPASRGTIKTQPQHSPVPSADCSAEEHVARGIECHERGSLNESTYHLRIAARQNHPTGMLLYALACRHGWGMRPNQREGVQWLRKAADFAFLEVADYEDLLKEGRPVNLLGQRTRKAQFALSIYELGVSHMNGWGIEQDKVLALKCFEIAGGTSFASICSPSLLMHSS
jgi:TPR repeat protein